MTKSTFNEIWERIRSNQGEVFYTAMGLEFSYEVLGGYLKTSRTDYNLSKKDFGRAFSMVPIPNPGYINKLVRGPSYVWAILHDQRISQGEW